MSRPLLLALLTLTMGCINLDGLAHNAVHCSSVGPETCEDKPYWDKVCAPCDQAYDFERSFDWMPGTLTPNQVVRPIPNASIVEVKVPTTDGLGTLDAYFIPAHGENAALVNTTLIYSHGNYASIEHYMPRIQFLYELGFNIFVWDYRGYGKSEPANVPAGETFAADARLIQEKAKEYAPDQDKVIVYGVSLGAIPSVEMSITDPPCALLLEVPFTSIQGIATGSAGASIPGGFITSGSYENHRKLEGYQSPAFFMAGTADKRFTPDDVRALYDMVEGPKDLWVLDDVGHGISGGGVPEDSLTEYHRRISEFLASKSPACLN